MSVLRSDLLCPIFGHGRDLPRSSLPTYQDIMLCFLWLSRNKPKQYKNLVSDNCLEVSNKVKKQLASIPIIDLRAVVKKMKAYHDKYRNLLKPYASRKDIKTYQQRITRFQNDAKALFDIASCKCKSFNNCNCEKSRKVPVLERNFLLDQRTNRKMAIGNVDVKVTQKICEKLNRKRKIEEFKEKHTESTPSTSLCFKLQPIPSTSKTTSSGLSDEPIIPQNLPVYKKNTDLSAVAKTLDRFGVSDRAGAAIVSATLQHIGIISEDNLSNVVDKNKIRRACEKQRRSLVDIPTRLENKNFGLYFDGRKDKTLTMVESRRKIISEEHISIVKEPGSEYMGHVSLQSGRAINISTKILQFLQIKDIDHHKLIVIGSDGTAINTGSKGGTIRYLEMNIKRPLQWFICQLHANELPLRHLFEFLDGATTGPRSFTGPIGKALNGCEQLPLVPFKIIDCTLPYISNKKDLSTDQLYLFEICEAIRSGTCPENLSKRNPGKIVHSRWLTTANRLLRLYVSSPEPAENFLVLVNFILRVYAPMWFTIKTKPLCIYGAKHLHESVKLTRYLPDNLKKIVDPVIQRNGYFGHAENILVAMLADKDEILRKLALRRILKARDQESQVSSSCIRIFELPKFNFGAENYVDIINWIEVTVTESPLTKFLSRDEILQCLQSPHMIDDIILPKISNFPCHTQATERCVKIVTEASAAVCGPLRRDGFIKTRLECRKIMPVFNSKKDYRPL